MTRPRFRTCFISAPFGVDTSTLRKVLEENGIVWLDLTKLNHADNLIAGIDRALARSDFVCAVLPDASSNVMFELGVAYARKKAILAILGPSLAPPFDIASLTYVRSDPSDQEKLRSALKTFLSHAYKATRVTRAAASRPHRADLDAQLGDANQSGGEYEARTARLFENAGFLVYRSRLPDVHGADFAVWIDDLPQHLGNPLLVEVEAGQLNAASLNAAAAKLREQVARTRGMCGLLVYWDRESREFPSLSKEWPLVLQLSGPRLNALIKGGGLTAELARLRNIAAHGEA